MFFDYNTSNGSINENTISNMISYYVQRHQVNLDHWQVSTIKELIPGLFKADFDAFRKGDLPAIALTESYVKQALQVREDAAGEFPIADDDEEKEEEAKLERITSKDYGVMSEVTNGLLQSTGTQMNYIKYVVVDRFDSEVGVSEKVHIHWTNFTKYYINSQKAGKGFGGSVVGVIFDRDATIMESGRIMWSNHKHVGGDHSFAKLYTIWDEEAEVHRPVKITVGVSEAFGLRFNYEDFDTSNII